MTGGMVAQEWALSVPERVASLTLVDTSYGTRTTAFDAAAIAPTQLGTHNGTWGLQPRHQLQCAGGGTGGIATGVVQPLAHTSDSAAHRARLPEHTKGRGRATPASHVDAGLAHTRMAV